MANFVVFGENNHRLNTNKHDWLCLLADTYNTLLDLKHIVKSLDMGEPINIHNTYYLACEYSRLSYAPLLRFARMKVGCIRGLHNFCLSSSFFFFLEFVQLQQKQLLLLLCQWRLHLYRLQRFGTRNNNFSGLRTEILRLKIEMKFSWLTFCFKSCRFQAWQKFVLLRGRTTASLKFGKLWQNLVDLKITGPTCLSEFVTKFFAK